MSNAETADSARRYAVDATWQRFGRTVVAGSPLAVFVTTSAAQPTLDALERSAPIALSASRRRLVDRLLDAGAIHPITAAGVGPSRSEVTVVTPQLGGRVHTDDRITVDDGSSTPLAGARLRLPSNQGPAAARNAGRTLVTTPFIAFLDADVTAPHEWIEPLLAHFADPTVGAVAPRVCGEPGSPLDLGTEPARIRSGTRVSYVPAAAIVVRCAAFDAVGGFDDSLRVGEDVDLLWRLDEAGWRCRYEPASAVWHRPRPSARQTLSQEAAYGSSGAPLALRHPGALVPARTNVWSAATGALAIAGQPIAAIVVATASSVALAPRLPQLPARAAISLALRGHVTATRNLADAAWRAWWPIVALAALVSRRGRWLALATLMARPHRRNVARDVAYGWGLWRGALAHRTPQPLLPRLQAFPGRGSSPRSSAATLRS
ncbi:MAG: glycosyltransferase [Actinomycetota bacterium]